MALDTFINLVYKRCVFLPNESSSDDLINSCVKEAQYELQKPLGIDDSDVELEATYTGVAKMLVADVAAIQICVQKALENSAGKAGVKVQSKILKKAQAGKSGAASVEWEIPDMKKGSALLVNYETIISELKNNANRRARQLGFIFDLRSYSERESQSMKLFTPPVIVPFTKE